MLELVGTTTVESGVVMVNIPPGDPPIGAHVATPKALLTKIKAVFKAVLIQMVGKGKVLNEVVGLKVREIKGTTTWPSYVRGFGGGIEPVI